MPSKTFPLATIILGLAALPLNAEERTLNRATLKAAIEKALPLLDKGSAGSAEARRCFTCHNQTLPVMTLAEARRQGFSTDDKNFKRQLDHTTEHLKRGKQNYLMGKGQGGQASTAGYALWALNEGGRAGDEVTAAVTHYLVEYQKKSKHWRQRSNRPPTCDSDFTVTYLALRGLSDYGTEKERERIDARKKVVGEWLLNAKPKENEDRVYRLRALHYVDADEEVVKKAAADLLAKQREDGGWAQKDDMQSDAYATGSALAALLQRGGASADQEAIQRGVRYLLETQKPDGSWHVKTRAKGFQTYFESGFPHGKDQFISIAASSWAAMTLLLVLPEETKEKATE